jgi:hypothetical protein
MVRKTIYGALVLAAMLAAWSLTAGQAAAQARQSGPNDLFYNYYVPPVGYASVGAQLYPSPRPTPPLVGHTYVTYQPLMPHEFLYPHHRVYRTHNPGAGSTRTSVTWLHTPKLWPFTPSLRPSVPALSTARSNGTGWGHGN